MFSMVAFLYTHAHTHVSICTCMHLCIKMKTDFNRTSQTASVPCRLRYHVVYHQVGKPIVDFSPNMNLIFQQSEAIVYVMLLSSINILPIIQYFEAVAYFVLDNYRRKISSEMH